MPPAYDIHPEFGYFCLAPRVRRELRVAVVSILFGMMIGAAIVTIGAGHAVETDAVSSNAHLKSSGSDTLAPGVAGPSSATQDRRQRQGGSCGSDRAVSDADGASAFEQGCVTPCWDFARPYRATGAGYRTSLRGSGVARDRRRSAVASGLTASAISRSNRRARCLRDQEAAKR